MSDILALEWRFDGAVGGRMAGKLFDVAGREVGHATSDGDDVDVKITVDDYDDRLKAGCSLTLHRRVDGSLGDPIFSSEPVSERMLS